jgi:hypothetical protein
LGTETKGGTLDIRRDCKTHSCLGPKRSKVELNTLQRLFYLGNTRAKETVPTAEVKVPILLLPLHLQLEAEARAAIYRLYCSDQWKPTSESFGQAYITQSIKRRIIRADRE